MSQMIEEKAARRSAIDISSAMPTSCCWNTSRVMGSMLPCMRFTFQGSEMSFRKKVHHRDTEDTEGSSSWGAACPLGKERSFRVLRPREVIPPCLFVFLWWIYLSFLTHFRWSSSLCLV